VTMSDGRRSWSEVGGSGAKISRWSKLFDAFCVLSCSWRGPSLELLARTLPGRGGEVRTLFAGGSESALEEERAT